MESLQTAAAPENPNDEALAVLDHRTTATELPPAAIPAGELDDFDDASWRPRRFQRVPIERVRDELLVLYQPPLRSRRTLEMMKRFFKTVEKLDVRTSFDLNEELVGKLVTTTSHLNCLSTAQLLRTLRIAAKFAMHRGWLRESPFAFRPLGAWIRITPPETTRYYTPTEVKALLATMLADINDPTAAQWDRWKARRLYAVSATCAYGAFRMSEAFRLWAEDVDLARGIITVVARERLKTAGSARIVPMPPRLREILEKEWLPFRMMAPPGYLSEDALKCPWLFPNVTRTNFWHDGPEGHRPLQRLKIAAQKAGLPDFAKATFSKFRHSWACAAAHQGVPDRIIAQIMGHTGPTTSWKNYTHPIEETLKATVQGFDY